MLFLYHLVFVENASLEWIFRLLVFSFRLYPRHRQDQTEYDQAGYHHAQQHGNEQISVIYEKLYFFGEAFFSELLISPCVRLQILLPFELEVPICITNNSRAVVRKKVEASISVHSAGI